LIMAEVVDSPIELRCPACGKLRAVLGGEGMPGATPQDLLGRLKGDKYCDCAGTRAKK